MCRFGGVGGYAAVCLTASYLKCCHPVPVDLGDALNQMLDHYADRFTYSSDAVAAGRPGGICAKSEIEFPRGVPAVAIEDPQVPRRDIGGSIRRSFVQQL